MQLAIKSDAFYLSVFKAWSRTAGYFYLSSCSASTMQTPINDAIHMFCQVMPKVLLSVAKAEVGVLFHSSKKACSIKTARTEIGHPKAPTAITTNDSTTTGIDNDTVEPCHSKVINMQFYWIRDCFQQGLFTLKWKKGRENLANHFTKHHPKNITQ
jgi:hypothetical protein